MRPGPVILWLAVAAGAAPLTPSGSGHDSLEALLQCAGAYVAAHLWLPVSMDETYRGAGLIDGHATYSNFRKFSVGTDTVIKVP